MYSETNFRFGVMLDATSFFVSISPLFYMLNSHGFFGTSISIASHHTQSNIDSDRIRNMALLAPGMFGPSQLFRFEIFAHVNDRVLLPGTYDVLSWRLYCGVVQNIPPKSYECIVGVEKARSFLDIKYVTSTPTKQRSNIPE